MLPRSQAAQPVHGISPARVLDPSGLLPENPVQVYRFSRDGETLGAAEAPFCLLFLSPEFGLNGIFRVSHPVAFVDFCNKFHLF